MSPSTTFANASFVPRSPLMDHTAPLLEEAGVRALERAEKVLAGVVRQTESVRDVR